jgi:hypothetical protein
LKLIQGIFKRSPKLGWFGAINFLAFFLNWAKAYGDLRIFHFLGLHALQVVPLFAWYFSRERAKPVLVFGIIYFLLSLGTFWNAMAGRGLMVFS